MSTFALRVREPGPSSPIDPIVDVRPDPGFSAPTHWFDSGTGAHHVARLFPNGASYDGIAECGLSLNRAPPVFRDEARPRCGPCIRTLLDRLGAIPE